MTPRPPRSPPGVNWVPRAIVVSRILVDSSRRIDFEEPTAVACACKEFPLIEFSALGDYNKEFADKSQPE